jgi:hypothetical protein
MVISENTSSNFIFHGSLLKAFHDPELPQFPNREMVQPTPVRHNDDGEEVFEIESILKKYFILKKEGETITTVFSALERLWSGERLMGGVRKGGSHVG